MHADMGCAVEDGPRRDRFRGDTRQLHAKLFLDGDVGVMVKASEAQLAHAVADAVFAALHKR